MMCKRNFVFILLAFVVVVCLTGCLSSDEIITNDTETGSNVIENENTIYKKRITIAPTLDFTGLDVQNILTGTSKSVYLLVFNTLIEYDTINDEFVPGLAVSWDEITDTVIEFKLRQDVKFHDGSSFTAEDVKFTIDRGKEQAGSGSKFVSIEEVVIIDDYTVQLNLKNPDKDLFWKLTEPNTVIICKRAFDTLKEDDANQIGTGPYMYKEWVQGDYLSLVRFEDYWDGVRKTEELMIRYIPEQSSRLIALQTGEVDYVVDCPVIDLHYISEDDNLVLWENLGSTMRFLALNVNVKPLDNKLVRQAIAHAIDRDALVDMVYMDKANPQYSVMHTNSEFYTEVKYFEFDQAKSKALLDKAGYPNGFKTTIYSSTGARQKSVANVIQSQLHEVGIEAEINSLETASFNAGIAPGGVFPLQVDGWGGHTVGPDNALRNQHHSEGGNNRSNMHDKEVDRLIDEAVYEGDYEKRKDMYAEVQQVINDNANWIPLAIEWINIGMKKSVQGFEPPHGIFHHWRNLYIIEK